MSVLAATDWAAWVTAFATFVTMGVLLASLLIAGSQLEDARRTRHAQLVLEINAQWRDATIEAMPLLPKYSDGKALVTLVEKLHKKPSSPLSAQDMAERTQALADWLTLIAMVDAIEMIGVLVKQRALSWEIVYDMWATGIHDTWHAWNQGAVNTLRDLTGDRDTLSGFETVGREMERRLKPA
jgi:hypothetical protein